VETPNLVHELILLSLEDEGGQFSEIPDVSTRCGIAGAALMELALRYRIDSDLKALWAVDSAPTGDAILDVVLSMVTAEPERLSIQRWLERIAKSSSYFRRIAVAELCSSGILEEKDQQYRWALKRRAYPVIRGRERLEAKRRIIAAINPTLRNSHGRSGEAIPEDTDIALVALAQACRIFERVLPPAEYRMAQPRIEAVARLDLIGGEIARTAQSLNDRVTFALRRFLISGLAGKVVLTFSVGVFGFFALPISRQFFPGGHKNLALAGSFLVFAAPALASPFGGAVIGYMSDRISRKGATRAVTLMMVLPALGVCLLPNYDAIGVFAPILMIGLQCIKGFAGGGDHSASLVLLTEGAPANRRGFYSSFSYVGAAAGLLLASGLGCVLTSVMSSQNVERFGLRIALLVGLALSLSLLIFRSRLPPEAILEQVEHDMRRSSNASFVWQLFDQWRPILRVLGCGLFDYTAWVVCFVYVISWLEQRGNFSASQCMLINACGLAVAMAVQPVSGALSDRIGRKPVLLASTAAMLILAWPLYWLASQPALFQVLTAVLGFAVILGAFEGVIGAFDSEAVPKYVRCSALSLGYNISGVIGVLAPIVLLLMIQITGNPLAPAFLLMAIAAASFVAVASARHAYIPGQL
jgi:MHS family proline/betaine transporter-like MFS transporter